MHALLSSDWKNSVIRESRELALSLLNPSAAELEHGLELHAHATVVESYGFSCFASADTRRLSQEQQQGVSTGELVLRQVDSMMTRMADDPLQREFFAEAWRASGVTCVFRNSGEEGNRVEQLLERLAHNTHVTDALPQIMLRATRAQHISDAKRTGRHCFMFTTNGVPLSLRGQNVEDELRYIRIFAQLGVRMMHLTYNRRNLIGDGCAEINDGGLSDLGRHAVGTMNREGVIVDVAHSSARTCLDAVSVSERPVVISHATCRALADHCRAKSDEEIKAVARSGGLIGICCIPAFLQGTGDIRAFLDHIEHAVRVAGEDHVAIGTDMSIHLPQNPDMPPMPTLPRPGFRLESFWQPNDALFDEKWRQPNMSWSMRWTNWPLFTVGLVQRGFSDSAIEKIIGGNMLRVARAVEVAPS